MLDKLGIKGNELVSPDGHEEFPKSLMAWHANLVTINRRKMIVLMNNETRYPVVIYKPVKKDFLKINELIRIAITVAFRMEGIREEMIQAYLEKAGEITFSKTANRSLVAKMNNAVRDIEFVQEYIDEETTIQRYISFVAAKFIQTSGANDAFYPYEKMIESLSILDSSDSTSTKEDVLDISLYQLKIKLEMEEHDIWRRVLVPSTYSFRHLHNIIQTVFDWQNYHLHEFEVERSGRNPLKMIMDNAPETMEYLDFDAYEIRQERFVALHDVFQEYNEVFYEYDFGDSWKHTITLENVLNSKTIQATYLDGNGERPPEDVGGEGGFQEFMRIMANEEDPDHENMKLWAETQRERKLSIEKINFRLKHVTSPGGYSNIVI